MTELTPFSLSPEWLISNAVAIISAIAILLLGWFLSRFLAGQVKRGLPGGRHIDMTLAPILSQVVRYGILLITLVIVLGQFGVQTASILAVLGAAGLAIALALQGTLSNIAAGFMLIWLRLFAVGEGISTPDVSGSIVEIGLFGTRLKTYDGVMMFVPNSQLWDSRITNYSREPTRMVEISVGISYEANIGTAREVLVGLAADPRILPDPAPYVFVAELGASAVTVTLRVWVKGSDFWQTKIDLTERAKLSLDAAGVEIPYNKLDIKVVSPDEQPEPRASILAPNGTPTIQTT